MTHTRPSSALRSVAASATLIGLRRAPLVCSALALVGISLSSRAQDTPPPPPPPSFDNEMPTSAPIGGVPVHPAPSATGGKAAQLPPGAKPGAAPSATKTPATVPAAVTPGPKGISSKIPAAEDLVTIDFPEGIQLKDLIKTYTQWSGKTVILSQQSLGNQKININGSGRKVTKEEAHQAILSALNLAGFTLVDTGKTAKLVPTRNAAQSNVKIFYGLFAPNTEEIITQIVPLRYADANTVLNQLRPFLATDGLQPTAFPPTNSLLLTAAGNRIARLIDIIKLVDVKENQPVVQVQKLNYTDPKSMQEKVRAVFQGTAGQPSQFLQNSIVDDRTNSLILVGPPRNLDEVVKFIKRLDVAVEDNGTTVRQFTRTLDYADAEKVAQTLNNLANSARTGGSTPAANPNLPTPIQPPGTNAPNPRPTAVPPGGRVGGGTTTVADLNGIKITADKATNSLLILATSSAMKELDGLIRFLDKRRDQVYLEADVIDISVGNDFNFGTSFLAGAEAANGRVLMPFGWQAGKSGPLAITSINGTNVDAATKMAALPKDQAILGILGNKTINIGGITLSPAAFIQALKADGNSNVLQTPSLMVQDNEEGSFLAGSREWITTVVTNAQGGTTENKKDIDSNLELIVKPQISRADSITLEITLNADAFGRRNASTNEPAEQVKRKTKTKVMAMNGQTIVMSGLQYEKETESYRKVPLLGDIPILGWLFRDTQKERKRTNLAIFLTPTIVRTPDDLAAIYDRKVKARNEFLEKVYGKDWASKEIFQNIPGPERGKAPPARPEAPPPVDAPSTGPGFTSASGDHSATPDPVPTITAPGVSAPAGGSPEVVVPGAPSGTNPGSPVPPPPPPPPAGTEGGTP